MPHVRGARAKVKKRPPIYNYESSMKLYTRIYRCGITWKYVQCYEASPLAIACKRLLCPHHMLDKNVSFSGR